MWRPSPLLANELGLEMEEQNDLIALTIDVVSAYVGQNNIRPDDVPAFIANTHEAIKALGGGTAQLAEPAAQEEFTPAVSVRKSLASPDFIISMIDGKPYKTLRRHLATKGLTPEQYRERYGLKKDYPMVAPTYSETRKTLAQKIGLGRKPTAEQVAPEPVVEAPKPKRARAAKPKGEPVEA